LAEFQNWPEKVENIKNILFFVLMNVLAKAMVNQLSNFQGIYSATLEPKEHLF
jgi:hypothetical protein